MTDTVDLERSLESLALRDTGELQASSSKSADKNHQCKSFNGEEIQQFFKSLGTVKTRFLSAINEGLYLDDLKMIKVLRVRNGDVSQCGISGAEMSKIMATDKQLKGLYLYPEEALFLADKNSLLIWKNNEIMSIQECYQTLLKDYKALCDYVIYCHLKRLGYLLRKIYQNSQWWYIVNKPNSTSSKDQRKYVYAIIKVVSHPPQMSSIIFDIDFPQIECQKKILALVDNGQILFLNQR